MRRLGDEVVTIHPIQDNLGRTRLDQKGVGLTEVLTNGGERSFHLINEKNLYKVIMRSDKPQTEPLQDWVCAEMWLLVLASRRKRMGPTM